MLLEDLLANDLGCAPHVLSQLVVELRAHRRSIHEMVALLAPAQRQGLLPLPSPLPAVPAIAAEFGDLRLTPEDRDLLLAISVTLSDDLEPLLAFDGRTALDLVGSAIGAHLVLHAGRVRLVDRRLAIWVHDVSPFGAVASVHSRLQEVFDARSRVVDADWHRARASLSGDPDAAPELTRIARELSEAGHADRALMIAREAAAHAQGVDLDEARLVAGVSAVGAGYAMEAAAWLASLFPHGAERYRLQGLAGLLVAQAHLQGSVPDLDPWSFRPRTDDSVEWYSWARAAALAAPLCAERGDRRGMRVWLEALREASARLGVEGTLRDPVVTLSWLLLGERDTEGTPGDGAVTGSMLRALSSALDGDLDLGIRVLSHETGLGAGVDPLVEGFEHSPLIRAYRAVAHVLLLVWSGDIGSARDRLIRAAMTLPVAIPFAGLGVVLARRLDLAVLGELGPLSRALTAAVPSGARIETLVDHGVEAFLAGDFDGAAGFVRLWLDLGAPQTVLTVPGVEEVGLTADARSALHGVEPPELTLARTLQARIASASDAGWIRERDAVLAIARTLRSPFARARIEAMVGTRSAIRDERVVAREHLRAARSLFELSGARAWVHAIETRLARLDTEDSPAAIDPLAACRVAWAQLLTARELEVAMSAVGGATNRDIAAALSVSVRTVEVHLGRSFAKLDVRSRVELTVLAHRTSQHL